MKYLSICSGIEAASVAFEPLGWTPLAFSEIEPFPRAVLQHHYPDTPCHGDFTVLKDEPWIVDADLLCGGTPCQAFSVAGNRQSLADDRGNLTLQFVLLADAIDALRHDAGREPAWILWENVPGVLSTNDNAFGAFLGGLVGRTAPIPEPAGGWTGAGVVDGPTRCAAWRILDAQHFGLAQRRKRVFVLARGGAGRWAVADALLPIIEGRERHPAPGRPSREGVAPTLSSRHSGGGGLGTDFDLDGGLIEVLAIRNSGRDSDMREGRNGTTMQADTMFTLQAQQQHSVAYPIQECNVSRANLNGTGTGIGEEGDPMFTLQSAQPHGVVTFHENQRGEITTSETVGTLKNGGGKPGQGYPAILSWQQNSMDGRGTLGVDTNTKVLRPVKPQADHQFIGVGVQVRRLTPVETSRLQGFPDTYCHIPTNKWRKIPADEAAYLQSHCLHAELRGEQWYTNVAADGPIYKANGNSWAVPCARYIGERIKAVSKP